MKAKPLIILQIFMEYLPISRIVLGDEIQRRIGGSFCLPRAHGETTTNGSFRDLTTRFSIGEGKHTCKTRVGQEIVWSSIHQRPPPLVSYLQIIQDSFEQSPRVSP